MTSASDNKVKIIDPVEQWLEMVEIEEILSEPENSIHHAGRSNLINLRHIRLPVAHPRTRPTMGSSRKTWSTLMSLTRHFNPHNPELQAVLDRID